MARICLCLTGKTIAQDLDILEKYRRFVDIAELRVDCLEADERFQIREFPELAGLPVILTIRRDMDGGFFKGGEGARISLLSKGLAFAEADRRHNFAYVDLEEDLDVPSLEEAARTFGTRIIRSCHNMQGMIDDIPKKLRSLRHVGDEIPKVAVMPRNLADVLTLYRVAKETANINKILIGMGHLGVNTRILAERLGSFMSYTSHTGFSFGANQGDMVQPLDAVLAAPGQLNPQDLAGLYRFREITAKTSLFGVVGYPLTTTSSPPFFNQVFSEENIDAVYVPFPSDSLDTFLELAEELGLKGVSVTVPYKEQVLEYLAEESDRVKSVKACNTIIASRQGWLGYNTDSQGFSDSLLAFIGKKDLRGKRITIIGAGGVARAVVAEVFRLKGKALILNRTVGRAKRLALPYHFAWGEADSEGSELMNRYKDIIIQTTSVGMAPDVAADPMPDYKFSGKEVVMDVIYKPEQTRFLARAAEAGCAVLNGQDMLIRQAMYQYRYFMGSEFPEKLISRIQI
ncbi:3-dehydroquinate dehydratase [Betaproteobacteria bacterium]|nr:3-dehydroquinate dehydratase [Betaproteobacteria bacterium]